jgi:microcystin-dependent protein
MAKLRNIDEIEGSEGPLLPPGTIIQYSGDVVPSGYLVADGSAVSRTEYADLFANIHTLHGAGDGSTTFNLPNLEDRFVLGKSPATSVGDTGGSLDHTHTFSHTHTIKGHKHSKGTLNIASSGSHTTSITHNHGSFTSGSGGSNHRHSINHDHPSVNTNTTGNHVHGQKVTANPGAGSIDGRLDFQGDYNDLGEYPQGCNTYNNGDHYHSVNVPNYSGNSGYTNTSHTHSIDVPNYSANSSSNGTHTHASGDFTGEIGNVSGGDGDTDGMVQTHSQSASTTGSNNPPYIVLYYLIKT